MENIFSSAIDDLLASECTPDVVRHIERGDDWQALWNALQASGFPDALLPEDQGGAGLTLASASSIIERCGAHALPLPFGETLLARALLAAAGIDTPRLAPGPIAFGRARHDGSNVHCDVVHGAGSAMHAVVQDEEAWRLLDIASARAVTAGFALDRSLTWTAEAWNESTTFQPPAPWNPLDVRTLQACVHAPLLAGAAERVLDMTLAYANQRVQFGRAIGKFQAVQHHLAVMAEHVAAARAASHIGCLSNSSVPCVLNVAVAKARASEAALEVARLAHALHGAIGFTEELDLQLFTRRLHAWRRAGGAEGGWHDVVGRWLVDRHAGSTVDLVVTALQYLPEASS